MTEYASLSLSVDSTQVDKAGKSLGKLTKQGAATERATDSLTKATARYSKQTKVAAGGMRNMRFAAGQLGFQMQDVAVQLQSGQNAMLVLGQQGSQIASIFGPAGAVVGALVAVGAAIGGSLLPSLFESKNATEELEEAVASLEVVLKRAKDGTLELTQEIIELAKKSEQAAEIELNRRLREQLLAVGFAAEEAAEKLDDIIAPGFLTGVDNITNAFREGGLAIEDVGRIAAVSLGSASEVTKSLANDVRATSLSADTLRIAYANIGVAVNELSDEYGASREQSVAFVQAFVDVKNAAKPTVEQLQALQKAADDIASNDGASLQTLKMASSLRESTKAAEDAGEAIAFLEEQIAGVGGIAGGVGDAIETEFTKARDALEKQIALIGKNSVRSRIQVDIDAGEFGDLGPEQQEILLNLAAQADAKQALIAKDKERQAEIARTAAEEQRASDQLQRAYDTTLGRMHRQKELLGETGLAAKTRYETEHGALQKLNDLQKQTLITRSEELDALNAQADALRQIDAAIAGSMTATERQLQSLREDIELLTGALESHPEKAAEIGQAIDRLKTKYDELASGGKDAIDSLDVFAEQAARNIQDSLGEAIQDLITGTEDWEKQFIRSLLNIISQAAAADLASSIGLPGSGGGGNLAGLAKIGGDLFGGFFADGGVPDPNKVSIVGEEGPELFIPKGVRGEIVPMSELSSSGSDQPVNVTPITVIDPNDIAAALSAPQMGQVFINQVRVNPDAFKRALKIR